MTESWFIKTLNGTSQTICYYATTFMLNVRFGHTDHESSSLSLSLPSLCTKTQVMNICLYLGSWSIQAAAMATPLSSSMGKWYRTLNLLIHTRRSSHEDSHALISRERNILCPKGTRCACLERRK